MASCTCARDSGVRRFRPSAVNRLTLLLLVILQSYDQQETKCPLLPTLLIRQFARLDSDDASALASARLFERRQSRTG
jgi:hypothetical protein